MKNSTFFIGILLIFTTFGCKSVHKFSDYTTYAPDEMGECVNVGHEAEGKIKFRENLGYVKIKSADEDLKYEVESHKYGYTIFTIFKRRRDRKSVTLKLTNGYSLYILYNQYAILTRPENDSIPCYTKVFYDL